MDKRYNAEIEIIEGLHYFPWIGIDFINSETKLLVLGESIYIDPEGYGADNDWIQVLVKQNFSPIIEGVTIYNLLNNFSKAFWNKSEVTQLERDKLARYMAFTDIVQRPLPTIDERPTYEDYINGWKVLFTIIKIIKPKNIIILGVGSVECMKRAAYEIDVKIINFTKENKISNVAPRAFSLQVDKDIIKCIAIKHPARYFSWSKWNDYLCKKIDLKEIEKLNNLAGKTLKCLLDNKK